MKEKRERLSSRLSHLWIQCCAYLQLLFMLLVSLPGYINKKKRQQRKEGSSQQASLISGFDSFYIGCIYEPWASRHFAKVVCSSPSGRFSLLNEETGKVERRVINSGSYNYLGFADRSPEVQSFVLRTLETYSTSTASSAVDTQLPLHKELEKALVRFLGRSEEEDDALIFGMGFDTNSSGLAALVKKGDFIISDALNHRSIIVGCRRSGATIMSFTHNSVRDLERKLQCAIQKGAARIFVVIEGIYSMEGHMAPLPDILEVTERYKAYLYMDEAHSIGAVGASGRGVCQYYGVDPQRVHILMGTFSKSFGAAGGYIVARRSVIEVLRVRCSSLYADVSMSAAVTAQILGCLSIITSVPVHERVTRLHKNVKLFRTQLLAAGFEVLGQEGSPVVPIMVYTAFRAFNMCSLCRERGVAIVMVGYPATSLTTIRIRFCISAAHTEEDIQKMVEVVVWAGKKCSIIK